MTLVQLPRMAREWAMPSAETFTIPPIHSLTMRYVRDGKGWIDPFAGNNSPAEFTNDLNPNTKAKSHKEALDFCKEFSPGSKRGGIFDPPYSTRQIKECYEGIGLSGFTTDNSFWSRVKDALSLLIAPGGYVLSYGWNSCGMGKKRGFILCEILLVCHGRGHNDTIVTVERRVNGSLEDIP